MLIPFFCENAFKQMLLSFDSIETLKVEPIDEYFKEGKVSLGSLNSIFLNWIFDFSLVNNGYKSCANG